MIDSRMSKDGALIRRRRECLECEHRFTTYEHLEQNELRVIKRDGARESFSRDKLFGGMLKACEKRPVSIDTLEAAVETIIAELKSANMKEIPSRMIGPLVERQLQDIDPVAYVRFASVYRQFEAVGEFIDSIERFERRPVQDPAQPEMFAH